jgi:hypothetical protein
MKRFEMNLIPAMPLAVLVIGMACAGCASRGKSSSSAAAAKPPPKPKTEVALASDVKSPRTGIATWQSVAELRQDVIRSRAQVDAALDALNQLGGQSGGDLRPAYDEFSRELDATQALSQRVRQQSDGMRARGREYFRSWQEQSLTINDPSIRTQAEQRQSTVRADFNRIVASMQQARDSFAPFMTGLLDIRHYLATDLTPRGVGAIEQAMRKAKEDGAAVQKRLDAVAAELDRGAAELSPAPEVRTADVQAAGAGQAVPAAAAIPRAAGGDGGARAGSDANAGNPADTGNK